MGKVEYNDSDDIITTTIIINIDIEYCNVLYLNYEWDAYLLSV